MKVSKGGMVIFIVFLLVSVPFFLALFIPGTYGTTKFSIFNEGWDGYSEFRKICEDTTFWQSQGEEPFVVKTIISSTSVVNRLNSSETNGGI